MTAVSQSYPNYLGGLNEQPDELKKPGQLTEALNVIPDPTIGLCRRPGFQNLGQIQGINPTGTFFEVELDSKQHFGCINVDGTVHVFDEDNNKKTVKYINEPVTPHKKYSYSNNIFTVTDDDGTELSKYEVTNTPIDYFKHTPTTPLKYCVSKNNIVVTNPSIIPQIKKAIEPTSSQQRKYYSYINLKVVDRENYNYTFKRFYGKLDGDQEVIQYTAIKDIELEQVIDIDSDYDMDLSQPWNGEERYFILEPNDSKAKEKEDAQVKVTFTTRIVDVQGDSGGRRNEVRHNWDVEIINPGKGFKPGKIILRNEPGLKDGPDLDYVFDIDKVQQLTSVEFDTVPPTPLDSNANDAQSILEALAQGFKDVGINKVLIVGNGIYLENNIPFSVSTAEIAVADVMNSQRLKDEDTGEFIDKVPIVRVNTVGELPVECIDGFVVEVVNSLNDQNNYFLRYKSESSQAPESGDDTVNLEKSDGYWEEIAKPYENVKPRNFKLPHIITVVPDSETGDYAFIVSKLGYVSRTAGSAKDNPSFFTDEARITDVNYYKNRLFFCTEVGTVVTSRAGAIDNMFLNTALSVSAIDPIDVVANSNQRVPIHGTAIVNNSMVLFGDSEQYSLSTSNDILTTETVNVTKISNYTYSSVSDPIYVGTNLGFVSGGLTRFYEMTNVYDRGPVDINERSQQIQSTFGRRFNKPVSSREQSMVIFYKQYTGRTRGESSPNMMMYRFRQESSQESSQTSWVKWQLADRDAAVEDPTNLKADRRVAYVSLPRDKMFVVAVDTVGRSYLWKMDSGSVSGLPASSVSSVPVFLDGWERDSDGYATGSKFKTEIKFPTIYAQSKGAQPVSDITANLTIHRVKLSTAAIGTYDLTIERFGYDTYNLLVEQRPADEYNANFPALYGEKVETVPVYTRNKNLTLTMSTTYDAPLTLRSMTWEGDWNRPYYKSV